MTATAPLHELELLDHVAIADLPLNELMELWQDVKQFDDSVAMLKKLSATDLDAVRAAMERRLRESGATSHTDAATGINCRIDTRNDWKVTNPKAAMEFIRRTERFELLTVDTKAAIDYRKGKDSYPIPGIEQVESKRLVVTVPKGAK